MTPTEYFHHLEPSLHLSRSVVQIRAKWCRTAPSSIRLLNLSSMLALAGGTLQFLPTQTPTHSHPASSAPAQSLVLAFRRDTFRTLFHFHSTSFSPKTRAPYPEKPTRFLISVSRSLTSSKRLWARKRFRGSWRVRGGGELWKRNDCGSATARVGPAWYERCRLVR